MTLKLPKEYDLTLVKHYQALWTDKDGNERKRVSLVFDIEGTEDPNKDNLPYQVSVTVFYPQSDWVGQKSQLAQFLNAVDIAPKRDTKASTINWEAGYGLHLRAKLSKKTFTRKDGTEGSAPHFNITGEDNKPGDILPLTDKKKIKANTEKGVDMLYPQVEEREEAA